MEFSGSELAYASHSATQTPLDPRQTVQELFDNIVMAAGENRPCGAGGSADVKLRFGLSRPVVR
ncbi:MAG: hypothetical protein U0936_06700 [Planctomycetaceae bacterium]